MPLPYLTTAVVDSRTGDRVIAEDITYGVSVLLDDGTTAFFTGVAPAPWARPGFEETETVYTKAFPVGAELTVRVHHLGDAFKVVIIDHEREAIGPCDPTGGTTP